MSTCHQHKSRTRQHLPFKSPSSPRKPWEPPHCFDQRFRLEVKPCTEVEVGSMRNEKTKKMWLAPHAIVDLSSNQLCITK